MKNKMKIISYWIVTSLLCFELIYGASWDFNLVNKGYVFDILKHLGYPEYLAVILGISKLLATIVIILPGLTLIKEWAYTGVVILFIGAFLSHQFVGDSLNQSVWSLMFGVFGILSWILRPSNRKLTALNSIRK